MMFSSFMGQMMHMQMMPHAGSHMSSLYDYGPSFYSNSASFPSTSQTLPRFSNYSETHESDTNNTPVYEVVMHSSNCIDKLVTQCVCMYVLL